MKTLPLCALLLALASAPAVAADPPTTATATPATKAADRAAVQREMADLQKRMGELGRRMGALAMRLQSDSPRAYAYRYMADPNRGMLGLVLSPHDNGLQVAALTPGGPAEQAGIAVGDILTRIDGKPVIGADKVAHLGPLDDIKVGTTVKLETLHAGKARQVAVKAERRKPESWAVVMAPQLHALDASKAQWKVKLAELDKNVGKLASERVYLRQLAPWWGLNLASMNPDLAGYFGTGSGALVLSSEPQRYPGLKAGDVITSIDGSKVERPEDVMRALRGQAEGKSVHLAVRRHGKPLTVDMKVPPLSALLPPPPPAPPVPPPPPPPPPPPAPPGHAV